MRSSFSRMRGSQAVAHVAAAIFALLFTRLVFHAIGFHYNPFREPFELGLLLIDIGMWVAWYIALDGLLSAAATKHEGESSEAARER